MLSSFLLLVILTDRNSHQRCSVKKVFLEISQNSQENTYAKVFLNKVPGFRIATLLKKRLWHRCICEFLKTPFFIEHL